MITPFPKNPARLMANSHEIPKSVQTTASGFLTARPISRAITRWFSIGALVAVTGCANTISESSSSGLDAGVADVSRQDTSSMATDAPIAQDVPSIPDVSFHVDAPAVITINCISINPYPLSPPSIPIMPALFEPDETLGSPTAPVQMVWITNLQSLFDQAFYQMYLETFQTNYVTTNQVQVSILHYPFERVTSDPTHTDYGLSLDVICAWNQSPAAGARFLGQIFNSPDFNLSCIFVQEPVDKSL